MAASKKRRKRKARAVRACRICKAIVEAIPTNWTDPLLTGPMAIVKEPFTSRTFERLINAVRTRCESVRLRGRRP